MNLAKPYETFGTPKYVIVFCLMELTHSGWLRTLLHFFSLLIDFFVEMPSTVDLCKRALVTLIRALAVAYGFRVAVTRDATDQVIKRAYHTTSKRTHPDKGGSTTRKG